jgi:hypothetical protein
VDGKLYLIDGRRVSRLRKPDLPVIARAIVAFHRGKCKAERVHKYEIEYVRFFSNGFDALVLASDWDRVLVYFKDGTLNPRVVKQGPCLILLSPQHQKELAVIDWVDRSFYLRVLGVLESLFTEDYPKSKI